MTRFIVGLGLAGAAFVAPVFASACRLPVTPITGIQYEIEAVALAVIRDVEVFDVPYSAQPLWTAGAEITAAIVGEPVSGTHEIGYGGIVITCASRLNAPAPGDEWVLYFRDTPSGALRVEAFLPLDIARQFDPRFQTETPATAE